MSSNKITIALPKGRIYQQVLPLLEAAGITTNEDPETSRKLKINTNIDNLQLLILRSSDVPIYVQYGVADLGIAGKDVLLEQQLDGIYECLDLQIAKCKMMVAGVVGTKLPSGRIKVATKYPKITKQYFNNLGKQAEIIKLYGAMELAPLVGLADCIVDLVETGSTLKANNLEAWQQITPISSQLIANKASMKIKHVALKVLINKIKDALI